MLSLFVVGSALFACDNTLHQRIALVPLLSTDCVTHLLAVVSLCEDQTWPLQSQQMAVMLSSIRLWGTLPRYAGCSLRRGKAGDTAGQGCLVSQAQTDGGVLQLLAH